jgi:hypothetical protein
MLLVGISAGAVSDARRSGDPRFRAHTTREPPRASERVAARGYDRRQALSIMPQVRPMFIHALTRAVDTAERHMVRETVSGNPGKRREVTHLVRRIKLCG